MEDKFYTIHYFETILNDEIATQQLLLKQASERKDYGTVASTIYALNVLRRIENKINESEEEI